MASRSPTFAALLAGFTLASCGGSPDAEPAAEPTAEATTEAAVTPADPAVQAALRAVFPEPDTLFATATADLDGDGSDEVLAYAYGATVCGSGGCNLVVLTRDGDTYRPVAQTSVTQEPIRLLATSTSGWKDLSVGVGGGGLEAGQVKLQFNGKAYPSNPTVLPPSAKVGATEGTALIDAPLQGATLPPA